VIDALDRAILTESDANARLPTSELARRVGVSAPTAAERVRKLEAADVILGYRAVIDPAALGLPVSAWARLGPGDRQCHASPDWPRPSPSVTASHTKTVSSCASTHRASRPRTDPRQLPALRADHHSAIVVTPVAPRAVPLAG
jgi:Lrp/AsnC family leucine-responsive transcriptional regulator